MFRQLPFRTTLPPNLASFAGVMHSDTDDEEDGENRAQFQGQAAALLQAVLGEAMETLDAGVDQLMRRRLRERLPVCGRVAGLGTPSAEARGARNADAAAAVAASSLVRLRRHDVMHMAVEEGHAAVYHVGGNTCRYKEVEEGRELFSIGAAPVLERLVRVFPSWTAVEDLQRLAAEAEAAEAEEGGGGGEEGDGGGEGEPVDVAAVVRRLVECGVLETRA